MSADVLLNLLNELWKGKHIKCEAIRSNYLNDF